MEKYRVICLSREEVNLENKVIIPLLRARKEGIIKLRSNLMELSKIPESKLRELIIQELGKRLCDYALITNSSGNFEVLIPIKRVLTNENVIYPRIAKLLSIQLLKKQERVEVEADAVFSRSLISESIDLSKDSPYYVYEGSVKVLVDSDRENVVAVRVVTDRGARVILGSSLRFEQPSKAEATPRRVIEESKAPRKGRRHKKRGRRRKKRRRLKKKR